MNRFFHDLNDRVHIFCKDDLWLCFDKYTNRVFELTRDEALCLLCVISNQEITLTLEQELIVRELLDVLGKPDLAYRTLEPLNTFYLRVNRRCNLKCAYCHASTDSADVAGKDVLSPEIASLAAEKMWALGARGVGIHGGDPFLDWDNILGVLRAIRITSPHMQIGLTCNGTLVTEAIAQSLKELKVCVSVELDGGKETHDCFKRYPNGNSSYNDALNGAVILRDYGVLAAVESTVSGLDGYDEQGYRDLQKKFPGIPIVVSRIKSRKLLPWVSHGEDLKLFLKNQLEATEHNDTVFNDVIAGIVNLSSKPTAPKYRCVCFVDKVSVDMDGSVFLCPKQENKISFIGRITDDAFVDTFNEKRISAARCFSSRQLRSEWFSNLIEYCVDSTFENVNGQEELQDRDVMSSFFEDLIFRSLHMDTSALYNRWIGSGF